ncbi:hypothetical protein, partial [Microbacterium sp. MYb62]|uniref:hypothetical protein n=1 Tax=Microbacterium sp. MYb62 TaxID=1848690 RepID=UPI000D4E35EE
DEYGDFTASGLVGGVVLDGGLVLDELELVGVMVLEGAEPEAHPVRMTAPRANVATRRKRSR